MLQCSSESNADSGYVKKNISLHGQGHVTDIVQNISETTS